MYLIDQGIANDIAANVEMDYKAMEKLLMATEEQADEMEMAIRADVEARTKMPRVARAMSIYSPLLLENKAITTYLKKVSDLGLRPQRPELLTAEEAALMAQQDIMDMTEEEVKVLIKELKVAQAAEINGKTDTLTFPSPKEINF